MPVGAIFERVTAMTANALAARHQIRNVLARHSRGVDRADANLLGSAYHADASVDYGFFAGPASTLVALLADAQKAALPTLHRTSNCEIRVSGDRALSESLVIAYVEETALQRMVFGRYLDRLECRDGDWRIAHRSYVLDGNTNRPSSAARSDPPLTNDRQLQRAVPMTVDAANLDAALSRDAIHLLLTSYCRAVDRGDEALMASLFWDDAEVISGICNGSGADFARDVVAYVTANLDMCFHSVSNEWIEVKGDHAIGEHYILAQSRSGGNDVQTGGRYVDSYERRGGIWKIASRCFVCDWTATHPTTFEPEGFYAGLITRGCFGPGDPVYAHWQSL
jgi:ketosteroid isomerase-like protein